MPTLKFFFLLGFHCLISSSIFSQDFRTLDDTIRVKYIFWSSPKYSLNNSLTYKNSNSLLTGAYKKEFKNLFDTKADEYLHIKKSENKYLIGNLGGGAGGGFCIGWALASNNRDTKNTLLIAGSTLIVLDIVLGINAFEDLKKAVRKRNSRVKKIRL
jgi:hypothetical protein